MSLDSIAVLIFLALLGALAGTQINRAVYSWCWFLERRYSPWQMWSGGGGVSSGAAAGSSAAVSPRDFVPILGWWFLRRHASEHGAGFWIRPLLVEVVCAFSLPLFAWWYQHGGPFPADAIQANGRLSDGYFNWAVVLFAMHSVLMGLMLIATLIDLDEKTIPDQVTIPGVVIGLLVAGMGVPMALPVAAWNPPRLTIGGLADADDRQVAGGQVAAKEEDDVEGLVFTSPFSKRMRDAEHWVNTPVGLMVGWSCILGWFWGLLPKTLTLRKGWLASLDLLVASVLRPPRRRRGRIKLPPRRMSTLARCLLIITPLLLVWITVVFSWKGVAWETLASSLLGMGIGGGLVWLIRIVASYALGQEAMGFGDVTLMAVIGAFLGWQPALLVFAFAPFAAIVIALAELVIRRRHDIAFGPYLCLSAVFVIVYWDRLWNGWAAPQIFVLGDFLIQVLIVGVALMGGLLMVWGTIKRRMGWMPGPYLDDEPA